MKKEHRGSYKATAFCKCKYHKLVRKWHKETRNNLIVVEPTKSLLRTTADSDNQRNIILS